MTPGSRRGAGLLPWRCMPMPSARSASASVTKPPRTGCRWASIRWAVKSFPIASQRHPRLLDPEPLFCPGFPVAWPMVEWVLDTRFAHLHHKEDYVEQAITVWDAYEGKLIPLMESITTDFPDATLFSLPPPSPPRASADRSSSA